MEKNKILAIVVAGLAILVFGYFIVTSKKAGPSSEENLQGNEATEQQETATSTADTATSTTSTVTTSSAKTTTQTTTKTTTKTTVKEPGAATLTYTNALKTYSASGYRFQINNGRVSPGSLIIKKGKTFMLDNRDGKAHTVKVGTASYHIGAYGFVIATAKTLGTNYIMVDGINTAKIEVE